MLCPQNRQLIGFFSFGLALAYGRISKKKGPKDHMTTRILQSGSKAQDKQDASNYGLWGSCVCLVLWVPKSRLPSGASLDARAGGGIPRSPSDLSHYQAFVRVVLHTTRRYGDGSLGLWEVLLASSSGVGPLAVRHSLVSVGRRSFGLH